MYLFELVFQDIYLGVGLQDNMVVLFLVFLRNTILFSIVAEPLYIPINSIGVFPFLHSLSRIFLSVDFLIITILTGVK